MRILVTGAGGLVGSALVRSGEVTGLTRAQLDITDESALARMIDTQRPDAIINAAAQAGVDMADREPEWTFKVNGAAPEMMAGLAQENGVRLIHLSTDYVLDAPSMERMPETVAPKPARLTPAASWKVRRLCSQQVAQSCAFSGSTHRLDGGSSTVPWP